jgi:hypothetical protein
MLAPCETSTSTYLSLATISSGLYLFLGISVLLDAQTTYFKSDHFNEGGSISAGPARMIHAVAKPRRRPRKTGAAKPNSLF